MVATAQAINQIHFRRRARARKAAAQKRRRSLISGIIIYGMVAWMVLSYLEVVCHNMDALDGEPHVYSKYNYAFVLDRVFGTDAFAEIPHN